MARPKCFPREQMTVNDKITYIQTEAVDSELS